MKKIVFIIITLSILYFQIPPSEKNSSSDEILTHNFKTKIESALEELAIVKTKDFMDFVNISTIDSKQSVRFYEIRDSISFELPVQQLTEKEETIATEYFRLNKVKTQNYFGEKNRFFWQKLFPTNKIDQAAVFAIQTLNAIYKRQKNSKLVLTKSWK